MEKLQAELDRRAARGLKPTPLYAIKEELTKIGYKLDRSMDCRCMAKWVTGQWAGETYPSISTGIKEADTGLSAFNRDARRDANFRTLQEMRKSGEWFSVTKGAVFTI